MDLDRATVVEGKLRKHLKGLQEEPWIYMFKTLANPNGKQQKKKNVKQNIRVKRP